MTRDLAELEVPNLDRAFAAEIERRAQLRARLDADDRDRLLAGPRGGLLGLTTHTNPRYVPGWFAERVCAKLDAFLEAVARKESPRLMLLAPPRHGKSELASRRFPARALGKYPDLQIIGASYALSLAKRMSRDVQRIMDHPTYAELYPGTALPKKGRRSAAGDSYTRTNELFEVIDHRGSYRAAGVGVGITGMGGDIGIIDDPVKDAQQALSETYRDGVWEWYVSTFYTRIEPGGGILLMLTRWHEDDLAGRLLKAQTDGGEQWEVIRFPALAEEGYVDADDPRDMGEALHPARWSAQRLERIKRTIGAYTWTALYQQNPTSREGTLFKPDLIEIVDALPAMEKVVRGWDLAGSRKKAGAKRGGPDHTAGAKIGRAKDGRIVIMDVKRLQERPSTVRATVTGVASQDGAGIYIRIPQDPGQAGVDQKEQYAKALAGYMVKFVPVSGDKEIRATPLASQIEAGNVIMLRGDWNKALIDEMRAFPNGDHDDQVDAAAEAFNEVAAVIPGEGLLAYYQQEAERAAMRASGEDPESVAAVAGRVGLRPPPGLQLAFGQRGQMYRLDDKGLMWVSPEDVTPLTRQAGWEIIAPDVAET